METQTIASGTVDSGFAQKFITCVEDTDKYGVHLLFNDWWAASPPEVTERYVEAFLAVHGARDFVDAGYYADPVDFPALADYPEESLGKGYYRFITENGLEEKIAINYRMLHDHMLANGALDAMPEAFRYAVLRGFQIHDFLHVLTGYTSSGTDEIALQAFTLAQKRFPYMSMWMAVLTARMSFIEPQQIDTTMTAISTGWLQGKGCQNIVFLRYEEMLDRSLVELRQEYGIPAEGLPNT